MNKPVVYKQQYAKLVSLFKDECKYLVDPDYVVSYDDAWERIKQGIALTEKTTKCPFSAASARFITFCSKFKMHNFPFTNQNYGGYPVLTVLKKFETDKQQVVANLMANIFLVIKKTDKERKRIYDLLETAQKMDENMSTTKMLEFKDAIVKIITNNKHDYDKLLTELYSFIVTNKERINSYIRLIITIINEDLLSYIDCADLIKEDTVAELQDFISSNADNKFTDMIGPLKSILTLVRSLSKPKPSGELKMVGELIKAISRFVKDKSLRALLNDKNIQSIEGFIEMIIYPITSKEITNEIYAISDMFNKPTNMNPIELAKMYATTTDPITLIKGLYILKKPFRIETVDESIWSEKFCTAFNSMILNEDKVIDMSVFEILKGTAIYAKLNNLIDKFIESINKKFNLDYDREYFMDIMDLLEEYVK